MILLELKHYIRQHRQVGMQNLLNRFDINRETLEGLMAPLLQQGFVYRQINQGGCSSRCHNHCQTTGEEIFYWSEHRLRPLAIEINQANS